MSNTNINILFSTPEMSLASALMLFFPLDSIDKTNPSKSLFMFKSSKELDQTILSYWSGTLRVDPKLYFYKIREIKSRLYA